MASVVISVLIASPICIGIWVGIVALGLAGMAQDRLAAFGMAAVVGVFAAGLFGGWAGAIAKAGARRAGARGVSPRRSQVPLTQPQSRLPFIFMARSVSRLAWSLQF